MQVTFRVSCVAILVALGISSARSYESDGDVVVARPVALESRASASRDDAVAAPPARLGDAIVPVWFNSRIGADADGRFTGFRPLHAAALADRPEVALRLIERGATVDARDPLGRTPLMVAAAFGNLQVAKILLAAGADPELADGEHGDTALHFAAMAGHANLVEQLLGYSIDINRRAANGEAAMHYAALYGHRTVIELLAARGADIDAVDNAGIQPLHYASRRYRRPTVELLHRLGARPDTIFDAVNAGDIGRLQALIAGGADVDQVGLGGTPLHLAAAQGQVAAALMLIDAGADLEAEGEPARAHPLHLAGLTNQPAMARLLIDRGADVEARDAEGRTPLMIAAKFANAESAQALLRHGSNPLAQDASGATPLHGAAGAGDVETAMLLLASGVDINLRSDHNGETPLHYAICFAQLGMIEFLVENGADPNRPDANGVRPVDYTVNNKSETAIALLIRLGADP